jgi:arylformamidase
MTFVWRGMTQAELDAAYDQAAYAPNMQDVLARFARASEAVRTRRGPPVRHAYGPGRNEGMDVYSPPAAAVPGPVHVFVHGGAWRTGEARNYAFPAELFLDAGAHYLAIDFDWVQDHAGDLTPIADQVRRALAWVGRNAHQFGGDPARIHLSAHSSGAHLAAVALTTDWTRDFGMPNDVIKSALLCSGLYDLEPVRLSARSTYVAFTDENAHALSAMRHLDRITAPLAVAYGTRETPEFQRQSQEFADALAARDHPVARLVGPDLNHFEILETMAERRGLLGGAALELMGLVG